MSVFTKKYFKNIYIYPKILSILILYSLSGPWQVPHIRQSTININNIYNRTATPIYQCLKSKSHINQI